MIADLKPTPQSLHRDCSGRAEPMSRRDQVSALCGLQDGDAVYLLARPVPRDCTRLVLLVHHREARKPKHRSAIAAVARSRVELVGQRGRLIESPVVHDEQPLLMFPSAMRCRSSSTACDRPSRCSFPMATGGRRADAAGPTAAFRA
jgi:hypothetical protein